MRREANLGVAHDGDADQCLAVDDLGNGRWRPSHDHLGHGVDLQLVGDEATKELGETGRVLLRSSVTEPVVRVMVEAADMDIASAAAKRLPR